jgi:hypothetical protein
MEKVVISMYELSGLLSMSDRTWTPIGALPRLYERIEGNPLQD